MAQLEFKGKTWEIPESSSPCDSWTLYFDQLEREFGPDNARQIWLVTWQHNGSATCPTNAAFNDRMAKHGIDVTNAATRAVASGSEIIGNVLSFGASLSSLPKLILPVALVFGVTLLGVLGYRFFKAGASPLSFTPAGVAAQLALGK